MRINKSIFIYLSLLASIPFGHSCLSPNNDKIVYTKIDNEIWPKDSIITINVSNIDKGNYMVLLELIYNRKYPFQNISIGAMIETNEQEYKLSKDIKLRNDYGQTTTGGIYTFFQKSDTIIHSISLTDSVNNFNIHLIQKFDNELVGIDKIGVYLKYLD